MSEKREVYKILFHNQGKIYEIYAHNVHQSTMLGFVEIEGLIFGETSQVLVDPAEEKLQAEFKGVEASFIPVQAIVRIDKVTHEGKNKILPGTDGSNVTTFPSSAFTPQGE
ncbi:DUF1820 family protein [Pseudomonadota bacterium]